MAIYKLVITTSAKKELKLIPKKELTKIVTKITALAKEPRPKNSTKLTGQDYYCIRQGNYRIVYKIEDDKLIITIITAAHRKHVYKRLS